VTEEAGRVTVARRSMAVLVTEFVMTTAATVRGEASSERSDMQMFRVQEQPTW
jgi:hypothetical protein